MSKIDLQIHTTYSDGHNTPYEIIQLAKEKNVKVVSVTDHDTISGTEETVREAKSAGIKVVRGVEITTGFRNKPLHVLGYNIDTKNEHLNSFLDEINNFRKKHFLSQIPRLNENLRQGGKRIVSDKNYLNKSSQYYSIPGLALFLYEERVVEGRNEGFYYLSGVLDVAPPIEPKDAFKVIHKSGGVAILSHPFAPLLSLKKITSDREEQKNIIVLFKEQGLDGLECYQTGHSRKDISFVLTLTKKYNLLITAGSDWHGSLDQVGETIKQYLPYYLERFGDLEIPETEISQILEDLQVM